MSARKQPRVRVVAQEWDVLTSSGRIGVVRTNKIYASTGKPASFDDGCGNPHHPTRAAAVRAVVKAWRERSR